MTLDDFLRTLESLIEDRESRDDDPGEGNFGCEDCRNCNHCRFCVGCDSCEDCTYCEESLDCTSCTQSKRCVGCETVSYCEDCRDCKTSRYLTLCVDCSNCVHCLACVGLDGGEFYVLNQKRTRKEYFALLRQVQELMAGRMDAGWRPPGIGLASEVIDAIQAGRDVELSAAPWLEELRPPELEPEPDYEQPRYGYADRGVYPDDYRDDYRDQREPYRERDYGGRERPGWDGPRAGVPEPRRRELGLAREVDRLGGRREGYTEDQPELEPPRRAREARRIEPPPHEELGRAELRRRARDPRYPDPLAEVDRFADEDRPRPRARELPDRWERGPSARPDLQPELHDEGDVPYGREQQPTQPFTGRRDRLAAREREPGYAADSGYAEPAWDDRPVARETLWDDSRERTVARRAPTRPPDYEPDPEQLREPAAPAEPLLADDPILDPPPFNSIGQVLEPEPGLVREPTQDLKRDPIREQPPVTREREPSSPWLDEGGDEGSAAGRRRAKRGTLRRAGRPTRKPEDEPPRESTGSGSYRTGSAPARTGSEGTHTGTGLRLGRKPKRR